jgi:hypothetical protein
MNPTLCAKSATKMAPAFLVARRKTVSLSLDNPPYRDKTAKGWGTRLAAGEVMPLQNNCFLQHFWKKFKNISILA